MEQALAESIAPRRFNLLLLGHVRARRAGAGGAGHLRCRRVRGCGRTHEIGIRLALGAERSRVVRMIVAQGMPSVIAGIVSVWPPR